MVFLNFILGFMSINNEIISNSILNEALYILENGEALLPGNEKALVFFNSCLNFAKNLESALDSGRGFEPNTLQVLDKVEGLFLRTVDFREYGSEVNDFLQTCKKIRECYQSNIQSSEFATESSVDVTAPKDYKCDVLFPKGFGKAVKVFYDREGFPDFYKRSREIRIDLKELSEGLWPEDLSFVIKALEYAKLKDVKVLLNFLTSNKEVVEKLYRVGSDPLESPYQRIMDGKGNNIIGALAANNHLTTVEYKTLFSSLFRQYPILFDHINSSGMTLLELGILYENKKFQEGLKKVLKTKDEIDAKVIGYLWPYISGLMTRTTQPSESITFETDLLTSISNELGLSADGLKGLALRAYAIEAAKGLYIHFKISSNENLTLDSPEADVLNKSFKEAVRRDFPNLEISDENLEIYALRGLVRFNLIRKKAMKEIKIHLKAKEKPTRKKRTKGF